MWDSDDSPSFNELLLCTFVRFAVFVTKQEIFEKDESNFFFKPDFQNLKSELRSFRVKSKPQKAFLSSGNLSHHFSKPSRRNDLSKFGTTFFVLSQYSTVNRRLERQD